MVVVVLQLGHLINQRVAIVAAILTAVSPFAIYYSQEARMYSLLALCAAVSCWALGRATTALARQRAQWMTLYVIATVGGLYTQYAYPFVMLAQGIWVILLAIALLAKSRDVYAGSQHVIAVSPLRTVVLPYTAASVIALLAFLPWLPIALRQIRGWPAQAESYYFWTALLDVFRWLVVGRTLSLADAFGPLLLAGVVMLAALVSIARQPTRLGMLWLLWLVVPVTGLFTFSLYREAYLKVLLMCVPPLCLLLAEGVDSLATFAQSRFRPVSTRSSTSKSGSQPRSNTSKRGFHVRSHLDAIHDHVGALVCIVCATALIGSILPSMLNLYFNPAYARDDYRGIAALVNTDHRPTDAVLFDAPNQWEVFTYYQKDASNTFPLTYQPRDQQSAGAELAAIADGMFHTRLFALFYAEKAADPGGWYERWLAEHTYKASEEWIGNIRVAVYGASPDVALLTAANLQTTPVIFGNVIRLEGVKLQSGAFHAGDVVPVSMVLTTESRLTARYKVFIHVGLKTAAPVASYDMEPVGGFRPSDGWQPGEMIAHNHGVWLRPGMQPGDYDVYMGLYDSATGQRLKVSGATAVDDRLLIGTARVTR